MKYFFTLAFMLILAGTMLAQNYSVKQSDFSQIKISFSSSEIMVQEAQLLGNQFNSIDMNGFSKQRVAGKPALPSLVKTIEVPLGDGLKYDILAFSSDTLDGSALGISMPIVPAQPSRSKSDVTPATLVMDNATYTNNAFCGEPIIVVEEIGIARDRNLATVVFNPVSWNPVTNQIIVVRDVTVAIRQKNADRERTMRMKRLYASPEFGYGINAINELGSTKEARTNAPVRYTIVANSMFQGALDEFADWKRRKGFLVDLVYTDDNAVGSTTTSISNYLKSLYLNATEEAPAPTYVLLVGDVAQLPAFQLTTQNSHYSDLRYACWTSGDNIPDCYIGRFSAQNLSQLTPQISKTLMYEQYTFPDDSYLSKGVLIAGVDGGSQNDFGYTHADPTMDYIAKNYINSENGFTSVTYYKNNVNIHPEGVTVTGSSQASGTASALRTLYNSGCGWVNYSAHGDQTLWHTPQLTTNHVAQMSNTNKPMVAIGNCCLTNSFQVSTCLGEAFLRRGENAGGVAYIGASEVTYWYEDVYWSMGPRTNISATMSTNYDATRMGMYDQLFHTHGEDYSVWHTTMGAMMFAGNMAVQSSSSDNTMKKYYWEIYHLMGDPSLMPYIHGPAQEMTLNAPESVPNGTTTIEVTCAPYAYVALTDEEHNLLKATYADANGDAILNLEDIDDLDVGTYEIAASAQGYKHKFHTIRFQPTGIFVKLTEMTPVSVIEAGQRISFDVTLKNVGVLPAENLWIEFRSADGNMVIDTTDIFNLGRGLAVNEEITLHNVCTATVWNDIQDQKQATIQVIVRWAFQSDTRTLNKKQFTINAPIIKTMSCELTRAMDSSFTAELTITSVNEGHATLANATNNILSLDPTMSITVPTSTGSMNPSDEHFTLQEGDTLRRVFTITLNDSILPERVVPMLYTIANDDMRYKDSLLVTFGNPYEMIDFENDSWGNITWTQGTYPWEITSTRAYEGVASARSKRWTGYGGSAKSSEMSFTLTTTLDDSLSFYYRVSSEDYYDKFKFYIDNNNQLEASGEVDWTRASYFIPAGTHTFRFAYTKDYSGSSGDDAAFIDLLTLPKNVVKYQFYNDTICAGTEYYFIDTTLLADDMGEGSHHCIRNTDNSIKVLTLTVLPQPQATIEGGDITIRAGETARLIANGGYNYVWSNGETHSIINVYPNETTSYTVTAFNGRCSSEASTTITIEETLDIKEADISESIYNVSIYPNPAKERLTVKGSDIKDIIVTDIMGVQVSVEGDKLIGNSSDTATIDISNLANGIYLIQVTTSDGRRAIKKFIKKQ